MALPTLDLDRILRETFVAGAEHHATLSSTNDRAMEAARRPGELPLLVVADRQTAGRGRRGNRWWTGEGSLAMSLLVDAAMVPSSGDRPPLVALAAAVAIVETVEPLLGDHPLGIRWPNDVSVAGGKLAGVLVEVLGDRRTVVGIGINTNNSLADAPAELQQTATTLQELTGKSHEQTTFLIELLSRLRNNFALLRSTPERITGRADEICLQRGCTLTLRQGEQSITGRCAGIAPDGALLLDTQAGRQHCYSGVLET